MGQTLKSLVPRLNLSLTPNIAKLRHSLEKPKLNFMKHCFPENIYIILKGVPCSNQLKTNASMNQIKVSLVENYTEPLSSSGARLVCEK